MVERVLQPPATGGAVELRPDIPVEPLTEAEYKGIAQSGYTEDCMRLAHANVLGGVLFETED